MINLSSQPLRSYSKADQLNHRRSAPKRGNHTKFSAKVRKIIIERDGGLCVRCKRPYHSIHHIKFASALGTGTVDNGCCVCNSCHQFAHASRNGREWFESYKNKYLIGGQAK